MSVRPAASVGAGLQCAAAVWAFHLFCRRVVNKPREVKQEVRLSWLWGVGGGGWMSKQTNKVGGSEGEAESSGLVCCQVQIGNGKLILEKNQSSEWE